MPGARRNIDQLIQDELVKNPTISEARLGTAINVSRNTISVRLRKLIASGIILPKGHYLRKSGRKIEKYIFISQPKEVPMRRRMMKVLGSFADAFPYISVTDPYNYIVFVPESAPADETDQLIQGLSGAGATTRTSVLMGKAPEWSPELPQRAAPQNTVLRPTRARSLRPRKKSPRSQRDGG